MTNSEDLSSSDSLSSAKVSEVIGSNGGGLSCSSVTPTSITNFNSTLGNSTSSRKKSIGETDGGVYCTIPFITICGEKILQVVQTTEGTLVLSNYRLYVQGRDNHFNIPLGLIDQVESRDIFFLHINCKDSRYIRCTFPNNETVLEVTRKIQQTLAASKCLEEYFAFSFYEKVKTDLSDEMKLQLGSELPPAPTPKERFDAEIKRMEFNVQNPWRVSTENEDYELCSSYPKHIIVPNSIDKKKLEQVACFRSARRFPAVVWRHRGNGAVICRCSQPEVGWFGWRSTEDEELVQNIIQACAYQSYDRLPHANESQSVPLDSISSPSTFSGGSIELVPEFTNPVKVTFFQSAKLLSYCSLNVNLTRASISSGDSSRSIVSIESFETGSDAIGRDEDIDQPPAKKSRQQPSCVEKFTKVGVSLQMQNLLKLLILDARSYTTAVANRARGGGCECLEYYPNCEIQFMNLANIHSIRKSFINVRQLCALPSDQANWFSQLENCKWLQHMSGLMKAAVTVVTAIEKDGRPVMVHCSDGWDRTPQIVSLAEILLDPYYRSLEGFEVLVEREWLDFGHKFGDRCGQGVGSEDGNERCPVFLQWLDCLHQLIRQFPTAFEFNISFLVKLVQHTYSNLFGTFLCNTSKERELHKISQNTISVWRFVRATRNYDKFRNSLYKSCDKVLLPSCEVRDLGFWSQIYLGYENPPPSLTEVVNPSQESSPAPSVAEGETLDGHYKSLGSKRSSSYENLTQLHPSKGHQRKLSDSSIYGSPDNDSDNCVSKGLHAKVSSDNDDQSSPPHSEYPEGRRSLSLNAVTSSQETYDNSENEDENEPNSEGRSESTVISANKINLKSIESSTDTLVAEFGFSADIKVTALNVDPKLDVNHSPRKTQYNQTLNADNCRTDLPLEQNEAELLDTEDALNNENEISLLTSDLNGLAMEAEPSQLLLNGTSADKLLQEEIEELSNYSAIENLPGPQCTVCEQSKAVLRNFQNHNTFTIIGSGNPSSASSGIGTSSYASYNNGVVTTGITASNNFLLQGKQIWDVDGLTHFHDETQMRLNTILSECQAQIEILQRDVQIYRNALREQVCHRCHYNGTFDVPDDTGSMSGSEVISQSSEASSSFEAIDHIDTYPPLWVPDFAVTHCMGCYVKFSLGRRKHHCRACGRVYCSDCSENSITLPHEQIFVPSRVCRTCYIKYRPDGPPTTLPLENVMNGGDSSGFQSSFSSSVITRSVSSTTTSVPYASCPQLIPYHLPGSNSLHQATSSKFKISKCPPPTQKGIDITQSSFMNGHGPTPYPTSK